MDPDLAGGQRGIGNALHASWDGWSTPAKPLAIALDPG